MISDHEIYQSAAILVKAKGRVGAMELCVANIHHLAEVRDTEGTIAWKRILIAVEVLTDDSIPEGMVIN